MSQPHQATFLAIEVSVPPFAVSQEESAVIAKQLQLSDRWKNALAGLYRRSGVQRRASVLLHSDHGPPETRQDFFPVRSASQPRGPTTAERMLAYEQFCVPLGLQAADQAIQSAGVTPASISHIITISCTGFVSPGADVRLIEELGLSPKVKRTNVGFMGCHGLLNGLNVAQAIIASDPSALVLVVAIELCSLHQQYTDDPEQLVANSLFADGAVAMILGSRSTHEPIKLAQEYIAMELDREVPLKEPLTPEGISRSWRWLDGMSYLIPDTQSMMSWRIDDHGFQMSLNAAVPSIVESMLRQPIESWLASQHLQIDDIDGWAIHPGGPRIVEAVQKALGLSEEHVAPSLEVLARYGNMSSPTVAFILRELMKDRNQLRTIVCLAFGPGLCVEACLLGVDSMPQFP